MHRRFTALLLAAPLLAAAQAQPQTPSTPQKSEPVVVPQVDRRDIKIPKFPSNDFELGVFAGTFSTQNFGSNGVAGVRLGYHITEDIFVEGAYGQTKVSDEAFRQVLPGGVFPNKTEKLTYYNVSFGWNALPGEVFFGRNIAKASALYLIGGVGTTKFFDQKKQTINVGFGTRLLFTDWFAAQLDVRDHIFSLDLLGKKQTTQNLEVTAGVTFYF